MPDHTPSVSSALHRPRLLPQAGVGWFRATLPGRGLPARESPARRAVVRGTALIALGTPGQDLARAELALVLFHTHVVPRRDLPTTLPGRLVVEPGPIAPAARTAA